MAVAGIVLYGTLALLPPFLHDLLGYPEVTTGFLLAPRGIATMAGMLLVGRLSGRVDTRLMLLFGLIVVSWSLWEMGRFTLAMDWRPVIVTGLVQGFGLGFLFVPLSTIAFTTLDPRLRTDGAGIFSLIRNVGASIGISIVETQLARGIQVSHQSYAAQMTPYNRALSVPNVSAWWDIHATGGLAALDAEVNRQAVLQAYVNDFLLIMAVAIVSVPLLLLLRRARARPAEDLPPVE
jgi:MFS transporter, DHA2 family, multidrug resistance protein